ncbi:hypothetical protein BgAZ_205150 [Babesia gibsoni]|uniref:ADP-ribosylation factor n=1 Tax=Babesia gibsoni TaxID=33632 RepID=A0AAD8LJZ4_BABGI|nr:hypothetical protein BgAZ_205150 [Babesia gibsoni]
MGLFNLVKRFPLDLLQWVFLLLRIFVALVYSLVFETLRLSKSTVGGILYQIALDRERILVLGLPNSGKSSILYRIKLAEFIQTVPTSSYIEEDCMLCRLCLIPVDSCIHNQVKQVDAIPIRLCEFGINDDIDVLEDWLRYASRVLCVLNMSDTSTVKESLQFASHVITQHNFFHQSPKYVIFNNKTDIVGSSQASMLSKVHIPEHIANRVTWINGSALTGHGIVNAMRFLLLEDQRIGFKETHAETEDLIQLY